MSTTSQDSGYIMTFKNNASHNIINRFYAKDYYSGIGIFSGSHYNTIQNSRFANQTVEGRKSDRVAL
jgi:hypothetical protein